MKTERINKKIIAALYALIVVCIGLATVVEKYRGTDYAGQHIYGSWWFSTLWALLTVASCAYMFRRRLYRRAALFLLHVSFVVILAGALTTHLFARRGTVQLRTGVPTTTFTDNDSRLEQLPFALTLKEFRTVYYPGTDAPLDYQSRIGFKFQVSGPKDSEEDEVMVSMNHIGDIDGYRLFQQSYDSDGEGITLGVSYDPYGIAITYVGYLMLLVGIIATLLSRTTRMRALYRKAFSVAMLLLISLNTSAESLPVVDKDIAHRMGTIQVLYSGRICPLNTVATDFVMKLTGSASWNGYSADEVFFSWMIYYMPWEEALCPRPSPQPLPAGKGVDTFAAEDSDNMSAKDLTKAAERRAVVEMFYRGEFLKIFPYRLTASSETTADEGNYSSTYREGQGGGSSVTWYSPGAQVLPREIPVKEQFFIKQSMDFLTEAIVTGQHDRALEIIAKIKLFQREMAGDVLPSDKKTQAELFYNRLRSIRFPVLITAQLALRWWLSGHVPLSNGYETMLFMAWLLLLLTVLLARRYRILLIVGPLAAVCCLLVAMMTGGGSQISPLMPVLQSPLLSLHVMTVMCAYALFFIQMLLGLYVLIFKSEESRVKSEEFATAGSEESRVKSEEFATAGSEELKVKSEKFATAPARSAAANSSLFTLHSSLNNSSLNKLTALSQFLLYPALFLLTIGIFLGAVWANVSWGNYWSWDPKESWALITLMVYAVPLHRPSLTNYHLYMVVAFLAVVITYFGVNFLLGGMHSYA